MDKKKIGFKIGVPTDMPPPKKSTIGGKFFAVWDAITKAEPGKWLPVHCQSLEELKSLQIKAGSRHFRTTRRDTTLYIYKEK